MTLLKKISLIKMIKRERKIGKNQGDIQEILETTNQVMIKPQRKKVMHLKKRMKNKSLRRKRKIKRIKEKTNLSQRLRKKQNRNQEVKVEIHPPLKSSLKKLRKRKKMIRDSSRKLIRRSNES
jgi:hypothetical protein